MERRGFIATVRLTPGERAEIAGSAEGNETLQTVFACLRAEKDLRAVVIIFDFDETGTPFKTSEIAPENFMSFPVPLVAVVKGLASEEVVRIVRSVHLCVASEDARFVFDRNTETNAGEALKTGLINRIAPGAEAENEALALAEKISELAPLAVRAFIESVDRGLEMSLEDGLWLESELFARIFATEDMREGTKAFFQKRRPTFRGR
ncbi:MAG: enoyl-CoA hydratase-related protein [Pyrinomonadaceae bacterium]